MYLPNDVLLPVVISDLRRQPQKTVTIPLRGHSMRPFLHDGRDKALLALPQEPLRVGDVVLAETAPGHYVLHRIVQLTPQLVTLRGDGNLGTEQCAPAQVQALAVGFLRKGRQRPDLIKGRKWRVYSWLWTRLLPLRRYLLFALSPHIPKRFLH